MLVAQCDISQQHSQLAHHEEKKKSSICPAMQTRTNVPITRNDPNKRQFNRKEFNGDGAIAQ